MRLFFLRHAEAEDGPIDAERALTGKGRRDARRMGSYLASLGTEFTVCLSSPLVRARETAELVLARCRPVRGVKLALTDDLLNGATKASFGRRLAGLPADAVVLLVGHEPSLGLHVRRFLGIESELALPLSKGMVVRIDSEDRRKGAPRLLVGPKQLP